jgi:hypothetical protein
MNTWTVQSLALRVRATSTKLVAVVTVATLTLLVTHALPATAATAVPLGSASSFAVLAGAGVSNTGPTTLNGDIGTFPTTTITNTGSLSITGTNQGGDSVSQAAQTSLTGALTAASTASGATLITGGTLGAGESLSPGVYDASSSLSLNGALTLNGGGDPNAVFIIQAPSTLTTASTSTVLLAGGAQSCNVFWYVGSSATLGTYSDFTGTILAQTSATVTTGVTIDGRVLANAGAVTLDSDTITVPTCLTVTTTTAPPTTTTTTPTTTTTSTTVPVTTTTAVPVTTTTAFSTTSTTSPVAPVGSVTTTTSPGDLTSPTSPTPSTRTPTVRPSTTKKHYPSTFTG